MHTKGHTINANLGQFRFEIYNDRSNERLACLKGKLACRRCGKFGHWKHDYNEDRSLKHGGSCFWKHKNDACSYETIKTNEMDFKNKDFKPNVVFWFTCCMRSSTSTASAHNINVASCEKVDLRVIDSATYNTIGKMELRVLRKSSFILL